jgi:crossover junction endodeoxyribonuclease RusA
VKTLYQLFVNGIPKPQPRPRLGADGKVYNPTSVNAWKNEIIAAFLSCRREMITAPVLLRICFYLPMPQSMKKTETACAKHASKPDLDNLQKAVMDALTNAGIWKDDALVYGIEALKWYSPDKTGAQIIIEA